MKTLADFKRATATPNVTLTMIDFALIKGDKIVWVAPHNPHPRKVIKVQSERIQLEGGSWLDYGKATQWVIYGDTATYQDDYCRMTYKVEGVN